MHTGTLQLQCNRRSWKRRILFTTTYRQHHKHLRLNKISITQKYDQYFKAFPSLMTVTRASVELTCVM
jgi:hypothetical protein